MPCRSYEDDHRTGSATDSWQYKELKANNDKLARIACKSLTELGMIDPENPIFFDNEVTQWWEKHKEADRKAQEERERKARERRIRGEALAKLTAEERKVLGLKK